MVQCNTFQVGTSESEVEEVFDCHSAGHRNRRRLLFSHPTRRFKLWAITLILVFLIAKINASEENWRFPRAVRSHRRQVAAIRNSRQAHANKSSNRITIPRILFADLQDAISKATENVNQRFESVEPNILNSGIVQTPGTPGWFAAASAKTKVLAKNYSYPALIAEEATRSLVKKYQLNRDQVSYGLPIIDIRKTSLGQNCPQSSISYPCHPGKYRSYTGHCNNVQNPDWGNANTPFLRLVQPLYSDGVSSPRRSLSGDRLPSAREVSLAIHQGNDVPHKHMTTITSFFGEFIFHDLAHVAQTAGYEGHRIKCCRIKSEVKHPECMPIELNKDDPIFGALGQKCMEYVRSSPSIRTGCTLGPREQINQVTSFLDASNVYGSSEEESHLLRKFSGGELLAQTRSGKELLPGQLDNSQDCKSTGRTKCFKAGDIRVNDNLGLTIIHTLFMREHNRLARQLSKINKHWNDDQLFEEARRIVAAEVQHITYNEFLPSILGEEMIDKYDLRLLNDGFYTDYDINANPGVDNAIATAVFSFIYTMIPSSMERFSKELNNIGSVRMSETYFNPSEVYTNKFDEYLMGMISQNAQGSDSLVTTEMTNGILPKAHEGLDFVSLVIQRGRDHGLAGYTQWRRACKLQPEINNFNDLIGIIKSDVVKKLSKLYSSVHDVDLFTGGLAERPMKGALVGPTFACLLARQFHYLRRGDRYWYENDLPPSSFTKEQLNEIRKVTLARIICENGDRTEFVQPSTMLASDPFLNAYQYCNSKIIASIDLNKWKSNNRIAYMPTDQDKITIAKEITRARRTADLLRQQEKELFSKKIGVASGKSPQGALLGFLRPKRQAQIINNQSLVLELASHGLIMSLLSESRDRESGKLVTTEVQNLVQSLPKVDLNDIIDNHLSSNDQKVLTRCDERTLPCDHTSPFRTLTGWCNNLKTPELGKSMRIFDRLLPPAYEDGTSGQRRTTKSGRQLPSPRSVSTAIHYDVSAPHVRYALVTMQWGQFLDHDLTFTPMYMGLDGSILDCKSCNSKKLVHPECWPIPIPKNDPFFPSVNASTGEKQCLHFVRSLNGQTTLGPREQMNQVTAFIDASNVYGSDVCEAEMLRTFQGGKLNVTHHPISGLKDLLPQTSTHPECKSSSGICFEAGDMRASEQPGLGSIHTIFMREHNRLVEGLAKVNPHWNDDQLYFNGRKIVGAVHQQITYRDFLPRILGREYISKFGLNLLERGYFDDYDSDCSATVFNEFAAAVFRFGHSLLKPSFERLDKNYKPVDEPYQLRKGFFKPDVLYSALAIDNILRGIVTQSIETLDNAITQEVTNHLLEDLKKPKSGMDLISLNLQRARDHGIPPYNEYRKICNLTKAASFEDLAKETPQHLIERLKLVYENVDDIDLFTGGMTESPLHGGLIGPTFGCILGLQFQRLRKCDRFWYETSNSFVRFTEPQLNEIRKMTLAKTLCQNSDSIDMIQRQVFDLPDSFMNPRVSCDSLPDIDLSFWRERDSSCSVQNVVIDIGKTNRISPCVTCTCTMEGPRCQSLKVDDCFSLASSFGKQDILNDPVCKVQCAFAFRMNTSKMMVNNNRVSTVLGFSQ